MTKNPTTRDIPISEGWSIPNENGVGRRTLVKGAAWSVPVVAVAVAAPMAAASNTPTCADQNTNLHASGNGFNDGANGANSSGQHNDWLVFDAGSPLFSDLYLQNTGDTTITRIQAATSLEMNAHDSTAATGGALILSDGTVIGPTTTIPVYQQGGLRWVFTYVFSGFSLAPGQTATFRTSYTTSSTPRADYIEARPYQVARATEILCAGAPVTPTESNAGDNDAQNATGYYVHG
ncbi:hypothetical protein GRS96_02265 [Rathayibacter sp. VKM Ac-2803]|uniref:hypothetical protein n=1 Tax=unclassified Rathayibacter TaxID=2609250 RepID=UPI00135BF24F|nr:MULTISPECIES: hypothetical protein [unclassified Rathayibacter]MWV48098.1 hypothetical protein [Rathayibacter sp. VKM Ac-2803]MWV59409.1 hypothetical protein [Rathayibacter sp. VKM Ac-2754]